MKTIKKPFEIKYRPVSLDEIILPQDIITKLKNFVQSGNNANFLLSGPPGSGKTTLARVLVNELKADVLEINASAERGLDIVRESITTFVNTSSVIGKRKVIILDEFDGFTQAAQQSLRAVMNGQITFILTCNFPEKIIAPIRDSRSIVIDFSFDTSDINNSIKPILKRCLDILKKEGAVVENGDLKPLARIVKKFAPDFRQILNTIQFNINDGVLTFDETKLTVQDEKIVELIGYINEQNFKSAREFVALNKGIDFITVSNKIFEHIDLIQDKQKIPAVIVLINKYQVDFDRAMNRQLFLLAFLTELMSA